MQPFDCHDEHYTILYDTRYPPPDCLPHTPTQCPHYDMWMLLYIIWPRLLASFLPACAPTLNFEMISIDQRQAPRLGYVTLGVFLALEGGL